MQERKANVKILINRISDKISGAEVYNLYLLKSLIKFKELEVIFSSNNDELNKKINELGYLVIPICPPIPEIGTKRQLLASFVKLPKYLYVYVKFFYKIHDIDIFIFESMTEKIFLTIILKVLKKKIVWIEHGPLFATKRASIVKTLYKVNSNFVSRIICVSESTQNDLVSAGLSRHKSIVQYIGIDTNEFEPLSTQNSYRIKSQFGLLKNRIIGFLGTVNREKGIKSFLEVANTLSKVKNDAYFIVIGGGDLLNWAKKEVQRKGISHKFYFTGYITNVKEYLGIFDILLFPSSHQEGLSISLIEAAAMGIPCIASDVGGNKEVVFNKKNGLLYSNSSPVKILRLIEEIFTNLKEYKKYARKVALDKFSLEKSGDDFYQLFNFIYYEK